MARPKKIPETSLDSINKELEAIEHSEGLDEAEDTKTYAKVVHLAVGVDLLGSKTSLVASRGNTLEVTALGVMAISGKNGRKILIPFPNIKACELI